MEHLPQVPLFASIRQTHNCSFTHTHDMCLLHLLQSSQTNPYQHSTHFDLIFFAAVRADLAAWRLGRGISLWRCLRRRRSRRSLRRPAPGPRSRSRPKAPRARGAPRASEGGAASCRWPRLGAGVRFGLGHIWNRCSINPLLVPYKTKAKPHNLLAAVFRDKPAWPAGNDWSCIRQSPHGCDVASSVEGFPSTTARVALRALSWAQLHVLRRGEANFARGESLQPARAPRSWVAVLGLAPCGDDF